MKSIKKYDEFILEYDVYFDTRSKPVKMKKGDSVLEEIKKIAPWYLENINEIAPIYRGFQGKRYTRYNEPRKMFTISPSRFERYARNTDNHYIELIDNSHYWTEYPKRSRSIICTTGLEKAGKYGQVYRVIPVLENSKIAVCPKDDVFFSFKYLFGKLREINNTGFASITDFNDWLNFGFGMPEDVDYNYIVDRIQSVMDDMEYNEYDEEEVNQALRNFTKNLKSGKVEITDMVATLDAWMSPDKNGFSLIEYNRNSDELPENKEVYTSSDCILVLESAFQDEFSFELYGE